MKKILLKFEDHIERLIETNLAKLFPSTRFLQRLKEELLQTMEENLQGTSNGKLTAPNHYNFYVHPSVFENPVFITAFPDELASNLWKTGEVVGVEFSGPLHITFTPDSRIAPGEIRIETQSVEDMFEETTSVIAKPSPDHASTPTNAFLIINGSEVFSMNKSVINIGRLEANDLIINDPRVSRRHAQLRAMSGQFVIFDLGSTGGTRVNGYQIDKKVLFPGDVISISDTMLILGQDEPDDQAPTRRL